MTRKQAALSYVQKMLSSPEQWLQLEVEEQENPDLDLDILEEIADVLDSWQIGDLYQFRVNYHRAEVCLSADPDRIQAALSKFAEAS